MTPEAQRIAIAEACGTHRMVWGKDKATLTDKNGFEADCWWGPFGNMPAGFSADVDFIMPASYPSDLNAMHEAEKVLTEEQRGAMMDHLCVIVRRDHNPEAGPMTAIISAFFATASQRAEAFLRTLDKWKETTP